MDYSKIETTSAAPKASSMVETFRAIGYSLETAVADIIDNSISADARNIWINRIWHGGRSFITIKDDDRHARHRLGLRLRQGLRLVEQLGFELPLRDRTGVLTPAAVC